MNNKQTIICYLKNQTEVDTWTALVKPYECLKNTINFVPFNGNDKFDLAVEIADNIAKNTSINKNIHFVALFDSNIEGISDASLLKDIMYQKNKDGVENIHILTLKALWIGEFLPLLDQIDNHNMHFDNQGNEHENFVVDYLENKHNFKRANYIFKNFVNYLYEQQMLDVNLYNEFLAINSEILNSSHCYCEPTPVIADSIENKEENNESTIIEITQENEAILEPNTIDTKIIIEEPIINDDYVDTTASINIESEIELDDEVDFDNALKILVVPKKCREFYKNFENEFDGVIRIKKITNLNSVATNFKQCLNKNKNTIFYFFPATSIKNQDVYEQKYLSLFNTIYKKFHKNPHIQFFKTNSSQPALYLENILNFDKNTKNVLTTKYDSNKNFIDLINWLKIKQ